MQSGDVFRIFFSGMFACNLKLDIIIIIIIINFIIIIIAISFIRIPFFILCLDQVSGPRDETYSVLVAIPCFPRRFWGFKSVTLGYLRKI